MNYLAIDFGLSKVGVAFSEGKIAQPAEVIHYNDLKKLVSKIQYLVKKYNTQAIVIGISEGRMSKKIYDFGEIIKKEIGISPIYQDETLTTLEAQTMSAAAGHSRKKRKELEDAFSATIILQNYLDERLI